MRLHLLKTHVHPLRLARWTWMPRLVRTVGSAEEHGNRQSVAAFLDLERSRLPSSASAREPPEIERLPSGREHLSAASKRVVYQSGALDSETPNHYSTRSA